MLKSWERSSPPLGWPRRTDSLCPECVKAARADILSGAADPQILIEEHVAEIKAQILVRDGKVVIEKACPNHGTFTDTLAIDPAFLERIESLFPGRDFEALTDRLHNHGMSSIKYGRGSVLTIDLTNRCNMMCDPCFMDANQVGFVHELTLDDVKTLLDDSLSTTPRRQMTVSTGTASSGPSPNAAARQSRPLSATALLQSVIRRQRRGGHHDLSQFRTRPRHRPAHRRRATLLLEEEEPHRLETRRMALERGRHRALDGRGKSCRAG